MAVLASASALVVGALGLWVEAAQATTGTVSYSFQLDGDTSAAGTGNFSSLVGTTDWSDFLTTCASVGSGCAAAGDVTAKPLPGGYITSSASADYVLPDSTVFTTGSKDTLPVSGWQCTQKNNLGAKDDLVNAYQTAWKAANGDLLVFFGAEKASNLGDNNIAIWLLQDDSVACDSTGGTKTFTGSHTDGDLLLAAAFTNGGGTATINVSKWQSGALSLIASSNSNVCTTSGQLSYDTATPPTVEAACAITNTKTITTGWTSPAKGGSNNQLATEEFYEGALDVTKLLGGATPCFNQTITDTRSSQSSTATIFDFVGQGFHTCGSTNMQTVAATASPSTIDSSGKSVTLTFYDKNEGSVVLGSPTVVASKPDGSALSDCNSSMQKAPSGTEGTGGASSTLVSDLTAGLDTTTLGLASGLTGAVKAGDPIQLGAGATTQTVVAAADAAAGETSLAVQSFQPVIGFAAGTAATDISAGGDLNANGKFDPGETWAFNCTTASITTTTTITGVGQGTDDQGKLVTFCGGRLTDAGALTSGQTGITSLAVTHLSAAIKSGDSVKLISTNGTSTQSVTASADAAANAQSVSVQSFTASAAYPSGSLVADTTYPCNENEITTVTVTVINPGTSLQETAAAAITYTFKETNTSGDAQLIKPGSTDFVTAGQCDSGSLTQTTTSGHNVGDINPTNSKLDPGETWTWTCTHTLTGPASGDLGTASETNVGVGHGIDVSGNDITYCVTAGSHQKCDSHEQDSVAVTITNNAQGALMNAADDPSYTAAKGAPAAVKSVSAAAGVLANDDPKTNVTVTLASPPSNAAPGGFSLASDGSFTYQPADNFTGVDTFTYRTTSISNGSVSNLATVTITVS